MTGENVCQVVLERRVVFVGQDFPVKEAKGRIEMEMEDIENSDEQLKV